MQEYFVYVRALKSFLSLAQSLSIPLALLSVSLSLYLTPPPPSSLSFSFPVSPEAETLMYPVRELTL